MKTKVIGMYPKTSTDEAGNTTMRVVYKHILLGTPEEIAKYKSYQESQGQPFHIDETSKKPLFFSGRHTGVNGNAEFRQDGGLYIQDDEITMLEGELAQETMPEMRVEIAREIRAIKRARNKEITDLNKKGANNTVVANASVEEVSEEETEL